MIAFFIAIIILRIVHPQSYSLRWVFNSCTHLSGSAASWRARASSSLQCWSRSLNGSARRWVCGRQSHWRQLRTYRHRKNPDRPNRRQRCPPTRTPRPPTAVGLPVRAISYWRTSCASENKTVLIFSPSHPSGNCPTGRAGVIRCIHANANPANV